MKFSQIVKVTDYDPEHECETPGAIYSSYLSKDTVKMSVKLPFDLELNKDDSTKLEAQLHYAVEKILSSFFK
jgi:hypothetical protein